MGARPSNGKADFPPPRNLFLDSGNTRVSSLWSTVSPNAPRSSRNHGSGLRQKPAHPTRQCHATRLARQDHLRLAMKCTDRRQRRSLKRGRPSSQPALPPACNTNKSCTRCARQRACTRTPLAPLHFRTNRWSAQSRTRGTSTGPRHAPPSQRMPRRCAAPSSQPACFGVRPAAAEAKYAINRGQPADRPCRPKSR